MGVSWMVVGWGKRWQTLKRKGLAALRRKERFVVLAYFKYNMTCNSKRRNSGVFRLIRKCAHEVHIPFSTDQEHFLKKLPPWNVLAHFQISLLAISKLANKLDNHIQEQGNSKQWRLSKICIEHLIVKCSLLPWAAQRHGVASVSLAIQGFINKHSWIPNGTRNKVHNFRDL